MKLFIFFVRPCAPMLFVALILTFAMSPAARAQTTVFTYQGRLTDGAMAANGSYDFSFALLDAATGGTQIGSTITRNGVQVANGVFTVQLDFGANPFASGANRFLEIAVKRPSDTNYTTLTPRQQLTSSPFSIQSLSAVSANSLSSNCVSCVTNAQIDSVDGAKITGMVANATSANTATTAGNVTGVVAIANGGTGSSTQNFVDLTTAQTIGGGKTFSDNIRVNGLIRMGSEAGTSFPPTIASSLGSYNGLVTRRINSPSTGTGSIAARTNVLRLERDGTFGGWRMANDALTGQDVFQAVHCFGINNAGAVIAARIQFNSNSAGTTQLYTDAQNIEYMQCLFGNQVGHQTQVVLQRTANSTSWVGTVTSTFNQ